MLNMLRDYWECSGVRKEEGKILNGFFDDYGNLSWISIIFSGNKCLYDNTWEWMSLLVIGEMIKGV